MEKKYTEREELYFDYLNRLRDSGETNMFGAGKYLEFEFGLDKKEAIEVLSKWMKSFDEKSVETEPVETETVEDFNENDYYIVNTFDPNVDFSDKTVYVLHVNGEKYRAKKTTEKRVYTVEGESKKFVPFTHVSKYFVKR